MTNETKKIVYLGTQAEPARTGEVQAKVFCEVTLKDGKLSIHGVIGPKSNGDCLGSCGQILDSIKIEHFAHGWDAEKVSQFVETWRRWHLNDMKPNCEHQTQENGFDPQKEVKIYEYMLKTSLFREKGKIEEQVMEDLKTGRKASITEEEQGILSLPLSFKSHVRDDRGGRYDLKKEETKTLGWLSEKEHPEGCLSRACPVCGYKYGTKWLLDPLPESVVQYIEGLPESEVKPAWV